MPSKRLVTSVFVLTAALCSCIGISPAPLVSGESNVDSIVPVLESLGGTPCEEKPDLTCVVISVPLDHFDADNPETIQITFAVTPALGARYGMFVQASPGGPGGEGIASADLGWFAREVLEHYDIVFFDQRGLGLSSPLECPQAYKADFLDYLTEVNQAGLEGYDTPQEQKKLIEDARAFAENCVAEMDIEPAKLSFFGTDQVAEDIEAFRRVVGDQTFMLYGVSYGTAVAQTYAAAHSQHLSGLILDGASDLTLTGEEGAFSQERAFERVLLAAFEACSADEACASDFAGGDALSAYDALAQRVSEAPISYRFPLPDGSLVERGFTFNQLEYTAASQMYSQGDRMLFLRALAAAGRGDLVPMARLLYEQASLDPFTFDYLGDPAFSDTMFLSVLCTDDSFFGGAPEERIAKAIEAGQASNGTIPRLDGFIYSAVDCAFWSSSPKEVLVTPPLRAEGVPTFVLNATLDPATPFEEGKAVFERLADGYHIYVAGGQHSIYGWGYQCPDRYITNFLVYEIRPEKREIVCEDWGTGAIRPYVPLAAGDASAYADALEVLSAIDFEIQLLPEYYYADFAKAETAACPHGGSFTFGPGGPGEQYLFRECAFIRGFILNGAGETDYGNSVFTIRAQVSGSKNGSLTYIRDISKGIVTVVGEYDGQRLDLRK
jgi:pimeloyl-ACP methyl ester carboxylesterase